MKQINIFILLLMLLSMGCENDKIHPRDYPLLITKVEKVNTDGAFLKADILYEPELKTINEVGFIINDKPVVNNSGLKMKISSYKSGTEFSMHLRSLIKANRIYYVRSYIVYDSIMTAVGPQVSFIGMGYNPQPLQINRIIPVSGTDGTPLRIEGSGFGYLSDSITLSIAGKRMIIEKIDDEMIYTKIPDNVPAGKNSIKITLYKKSLDSEEKFEVFPPKVDEYSLKAGFDNSYIKITGRYFGYSRTNGIYINNSLCKIVSRNDSILEAYTPEMSFAGMTDIKVVVGGKMSETSPFEVTTHTISSITPLNGILGTRIHVSGERFVINGYSPVVKVNGIQASIYNISPNSFSFTVPYLAKGAYKVSVEVGKKSVVYNSLFNLESSWISNYTTESKPIENQTICQVGKDVYFGLGYYKNELWRYDVETHNVTQLSPIPGLDLSQLKNSYLFYKDNLLFASLNGGVYKYQIGLNEWTKICAPFINSCYWTVYYNNNLYAAEDNYESGYLRTKIYRFNFENGAWTYLYNFQYQSPLFHFILRDKLYIWAVNAAYSGSFFEFNIDEGTLITKRRFPGNYWPYQSNQSHTVSIDNRGYLFIESQAEMWEYDPEFDIWVQHETFPDRRHNVLIFTNSDGIHVGHGQVSLGPWKNDFWVLKIP